MKYLFAALNLLLISSATFSQIPKTILQGGAGEDYKAGQFSTDNRIKSCNYFLFNKRYLPWRKDVYMCLTDIEKHNLEVIKNWEVNLSKKI